MLRLISVAVCMLLVAAPILGDDIDLEKIKSQLPEGVLPEGFNTTSLPSIDDAKNIFKEKCLKTSGSETAFVEAEHASEYFRDCITGLVDVSQLQSEIEEAQPKGELDTVFNKYCRKRNIAIECMHNLTISISPCLDKKENDNKQTFIRIFTSLLNFVCHKDGDQIALFIAEKGPECFTEKKDAVIQCINSTMSGYIPKETPTLENLPKLIMGAKECTDMDTLKHCIVKELEACEESTPANLVESMFKFVRNETPCENISSSARVQLQPTSKANTFSTPLSLLATIMTAITARIMIL